jgi:hypothetical protein
MTKQILLIAACLVASGTLAGPVLAKSNSTSADTCHSRSYSYLIGANFVESRNIGDSYRLLEAGRDPGPVQPNRLTIVYNPSTELIVSLSCG